MSAVEAWFVAGTVPLIVAGGLHVVLTLVDTVRPTYFTPRDPSARATMEGTPMRFGGWAAPPVWRAWLGFNLSHGLGVFSFGLLCLLVALQDFDLVLRIDAMRPLTVAFSAAYLVLALRFWFWGPVAVTATATACFAIAAVLSA